MKRKAKTLALLGLLSLLLLGLLYWRFAPPKVSAKDDRPKVDIFAEAFGRGNFKRCYSLLGDDFRAWVTESEFVDKLHQGPGRQSPRLGEFKEVSLLRRLPGREPATSDELHLRRLPRREPAISDELQWPSGFLFGIYFTNGRIELHLETQDGDADSPIEWLSLRYILIHYFTPTPTPAPAHDPIS